MFIVLLDNNIFECSCGDFGQQVRKQEWQRLRLIFSIATVLVESEALQAPLICVLSLTGRPYQRGYCMAASCNGAHRG